MQRDFVYLRDSTGNALAGVSLTIYSPGTTVPVTLYSPSSSLDNPTTTIGNPVLTDVEGFASWAIPDGDYDVVISGGSLTTRTIRRVNYFDSSTFTLGGGGTVTSVALSVPAELSVAGSPITTNGALAISWASGTGSGVAGKFIGTPAGGGAGVYASRVLTAQDIPNISGASVTSGILVTLYGGNGESLSAYKYTPSQFSLACKAVSTTNINAGGGGPGTATFGGVTVTTGQRILLAGQTAPAENGPWNWNGAATPLSRPEDFATASTREAYEDRLFYVVGDGTFWRLTTTGAITVDTTALAFSQVAIKGAGGTTSQLVYQTATGYGTSANALYDGTNITLGGTTPAATNSGMIWFDVTQQRLKVGIGTSPANYAGTVPVTTAVGNVGANITTAGQVTTLTSLYGSSTIPANTLKVGSVIRFKQYINSTGLTATPGFALFLPGSVVTAAVEAMTVLATVFCVEGLIEIKTIGGAGTMECQLSVWHVGASNAVLGASSVAAVAIDTTASLVFDHKITLTGVAAGSVTPRPYVLEVLS